MVDTFLEMAADSHVPVLSGTHSVEHFKRFRFHTIFVVTLQRKIREAF